MPNRITFETRGNFKRTETFLQRLIKNGIYKDLNSLAEKGVMALKSSTPVDTGSTADGWYYTIDRKGKNYQINWCNSNANDGVNIAIILQYGHGTRTGGYVRGRDYINPTMRPIFDAMTKEVWTEVTK